LLVKVYLGIACISFTMFTYIYIFDSLKIRSGTQIVIVGKKSGAQMGADPGVSTQVVVEPLLVRACLVLHTWALSAGQRLVLLGCEESVA